MDSQPEYTAATTDQDAPIADDTAKALQLLVNLHGDASRQGPGGAKETKQALELTGISSSPRLSVADIGCGTGAATLLLAQELNDAHITAVDIVPDFLDSLMHSAQEHNLAKHITTLHAPMQNLPFGMHQFDVIWSEGAIYNMGFAAGIAAWTRFLKPNGILVLSEITWLTPTRPKEINDYWQQAYPGIKTASANMDTLERHGYSPLGYFALPSHCWRENYYTPLEKSFPAFLERNEHSQLAQEIVAAAKEEIALYEKFKQFYGYAFYIARRIGSHEEKES